MSLVLPAQLSGAMTDREAITDALNRAVLSFDMADEALLHSAVTDGLYAEMPAVTSKGIEELKAIPWAHISKMVTTHLVSNVRVDITDSQNAKVTASVIAQHVVAGKEFEMGNKFLAGSVYLCDVVKVEGLWKLSSWKVKIIWTEGDRAVMNGDGNQ